MARDKMFEPTFQKAFTEAIHKENQTRMKWHLEYGTKLKRGGPVDWDEDPDDDEDDVSDDPDQKGALQKEKKPPPRGTDSAEKLAWPAQSATGTNTITRIAEARSVMKPVPPKTRSLLYKGISHDGQGRAGYLRDRARTDPENKYFFPICSSWEYGWTYSQPNELSCPDHGRCNIVAQSFYRPNDVQLKPRD